MKLKERQKVEIERATTKGLQKSMCYYYEFNGVQYGMIKSNKDKRFYFIHLDSGYSVADLPTTGNSEKKAFEKLKTEIQAIKPAKLNRAIEKAKRELSKKGIEYPVN